MRKRWWWIVVAVIVLAPLAWYLASPLFITRRVDEAFPAGEARMSKGATVPEGMTVEQVEETMMAASKKEAKAAEPVPTAAAAVAVLRGAFTGADSFHRGEGTATVYGGGDALLLRLDPFKVTNGPDLHVILTTHPAPRSSADVRQGYLEVGKLKGNVGSQNYPLPAEFQPGTHQAVVIYCKPFHVVFATATLQRVK